VRFRLRRLSGSISSDSLLMAFFEFDKRSTVATRVQQIVVDFPDGAEDKLVNCTKCGGIRALSLSLRTTAGPLTHRLSNRPF
jgi:hypothetical protein